MIDDEEDRSSRRRFEPENRRKIRAPTGEKQGGEPELVEVSVNC